MQVHSFAHKLTSNENFKSMIDEGWSWTVVSHEVDDEFPAFAKIAQKALNTSNHVATQVGELEAAVTLADLIDDTAVMSGKHDNTPGIWEKEAVAQVVDLCLPCSTYVQVLMDFVKLYGGGPGAPLVRFMDGVAKQFGCNATLGSSFWHCITYTNLGNKMCKRPLIRVALALCNLQTDQKEDGIAKLLTPGDVKRLTSKVGLSQSKQLECMLKEAMDILEAVVKANANGKVRDQFMKPMGQLFVRGALKCAGKPMTSGNGKAITDVGMKQMFMEDMSEAAGTIIKYKDWNANATEAQVDPEHDHETQAVTHGFASIADHSNPEWIAKQGNFVVGQVVQQKNVAGKAFKIISIDTNGVQLQMVGSYSGEVFESAVKLQDLLDGFTQFKGQLPEKLSVNQMASKVAQGKGRACSLLLTFSYLLISSSLIPLSPHRTRASKGVHIQG